ncbi:hypothetical protein ACHAWT_003752 [Skeletonema menzelii]
MAIKRRSSTRISTPADGGGSSNDKQQQQQQQPQQLRSTNKKQKRSSSNNSTIKKSHWSRPGVEAAARLVSLPISSSDCNNNHFNSWNTALSHYESMIQAKGNTQLYKLDQLRNLIAQQWKNDSQIKESCSSSSSSMTKDQLLNVIIPWKFGKGKPRNALKKLLQSNTEEDVIKASMLAFHHADNCANNDNSDFDHDTQQNVQNAIQSLCQLNGVGPATASAVLSAYCPQSFAFMDDEVIECLYEAKRGYTLKIYMMVNDRCVGIAKELNEANSDCSSGEGELWTPADVGKALWTVATMSARKDEVSLCKVFGD